MKKAFNFSRKYSNKSLGLNGFIEVNGVYGRYYTAYFFQLGEDGKINKSIFISDIDVCFPLKNKEIFTECVSIIKNHQAFKVFN